MKQYFKFTAGLLSALTFSAIAQTTTGPTPAVTGPRPVTGLAPKAVSGLTSKPVSGFAPRPVSGFSSSPVTGLTNISGASPTTRVTPLATSISSNSPIIRPNFLTSRTNVVVVPQTRVVGGTNLNFTTGTNRVLTPLF